MSIRIAHEAPLSIVREVDKLTDYSYFLVHLFEESSEYLKWAYEVTASGRECILDNSIFELEEAFDGERFAYWVEKISPSWYIVPDCLEDKKITEEQFTAFTKQYPNLPGKSIGVVQGKNYEEVVECYNFMKERADMIAISFDYSFFEEVFPNEKNKYHKWMKGRQWLLNKMLDEEVIDTSKPHHLLGCGIATEFAYYRNWKWINSLDTSNPVVAGIKNLEYKRTPEYDLWGLDDKPSQKLFEMINWDLTEEQKEKIFFNIEKFRYNIL